MSKATRSLYLLFILFISSVGPFAVADDRQFIMIVDTSGSMQGNDPARYSVQVAKIINDLLSEQDNLSVIKFPKVGRCGSPYTSSLVQSGGTQVKEQIDSHLQLGDETHFSATVASARHLFDQNAVERKMLLIISDEGGRFLSQCADIQSNIQHLKDQKIDMAAINIGKGDLSSGNSFFDYQNKVNNSQNLIKSVAEIYQKFIGGVQTQTGVVGSKRITVKVDPYVKNAYLVVAADGNVGDINAAISNPTAQSIDTNHKGGGTTIGHKTGTLSVFGLGKGKARSYRIVHLTNPGSGDWKFTLPQLADDAGWMLIQDYSIGVRFISPPSVSQGSTIEVEAELYDEVTGEAVPIQQGMTLEINNGGEDVPFINDGNSLKASFTPTATGEQEYNARLRGGNIDKKTKIKVNIEKANWKMEAQLPEKTDVGQEVEISVQLSTNGDSIPTQLPDTVYAQVTGGERILLNKEGGNNDAPLYTTHWTPKRTGIQKFTFKAEGQVQIPPVSKQMEVIGSASFGDIPVIDFGKTGSKTEIKRVLDLSTTKLYGSVNLSVESTFNKSNSHIEINTDNKWIDISDNPHLTLTNTANKWFVRLIVERCPEGSQSDETYSLKLSFKRADGSLESATVPLKAEIIKDYWLVCWWPYIAAAISAILFFWIMHCIRTPARFPAEFGLVLSDVPELNEEGHFHRIKMYSDSRWRFCKDAYIHMHQNTQFSKSPKGAYIRLQARKDGIYIVSTGNGTLLSKQFGSVWEEVPVKEELRLRSGTIYRNEMEDLFFEAREK